MFKFDVHDKDFKVSQKCVFVVTCVAVAIKPEGVAIRDTKTGNTMFFDHAEFDAFRQGVKAGEFDVA